MTQANADLQGVVYSIAGTVTESSENTRVLEHQLLHVAMLCMLPAVSMLSGGLLVQFLAQPGPKLISGLQHFAGGVIIAAVASELMPIIATKKDGSLTSHQQTMESVAVVSGFVLGVATMLFIGRFIAVHEEDEKPSYSHLNSFRSISISLAAGERSPLLNTTTPPGRGGDSGVVPWGLVCAAGIDSLMDGLLLGISISAGEQVGIILSIALTIEMCFLGISVSSTLRAHQAPPTLSRVIAVALPSLIIAGSLIGYSILSNFSGPPFLGLISFGIASLLYLVTDELMIEAHSDMENDTLLVTIQFFLGYLLVMILQR